MQVKGKQVKDYIIGDQIIDVKGVQLYSAVTTTNKLVTVLLVQKKDIEQATFISYNNLILENVNKIHPKYIEAVQSTNNIYLILEPITYLPLGYKEY